MGNDPRYQVIEHWERRELQFIHGICYLLLIGCVIADAAGLGGSRSRVPTDLGLAVAALVVMLYADRLDDRNSRLQRQETIPSWQAAPVFVLWVVISGVLVANNPLYGFYAWTGYLWSWRLLHRNWRFVGVALAAIPVAMSQTGSGPYKNAGDFVALAAVYLVNFIVAGLMTWFGWLDNEQHQRRAAEIDALTEANERLAASLAENAELHKQLVTQAREAGVADERRRMAREIHDTLAQGLTGIITQLQAAQGTVTGAQSSARIEAAISLARESLAEARRSVQALAPQPLAGARLPDAVQDVADRWSELSGTTVSVTTTGTVGEMSAQTELALLRAAQEALANVAKHAHAQRVGLTLSYMADVVTLDVRDDGVGFETVHGSGPRRPVDAQGGFGLEAMRQRIEELGGSLTVEAERGSGTAISASVPVGCS
jgi:signal transduction histidine kinase